MNVSSEFSAVCLEWLYVFFFFDTEGEIVIACNQILKMLAFVIVSSGTFSSLVLLFEFTKEKFVLE